MQNLPRDLIGLRCKTSAYVLNVVGGEASDGQSPFADWVDSLKDLKTVNIIQKRLGFLRQGNRGGFKFFDGIYELRIDYGPGYRIYCGKKDKTYVLLLLGGSKASQRKDVEKAIQYWIDFQKRNVP